MPAETHSVSEPHSYEDVVDLIKERVCEILGLEPNEISDSSSFVGDLGADSLAMLALIDALEADLGERSVGFAVEDEDLIDISTVGELAEYLFGRQ